MATMITSECINCGACEPECPNTAIYQGGVDWELNGEKHGAISTDIFYIVPEKCTECVGFYDHEACAAVCPVDCCVPNPDIPESEEVLIARARVLHPEESFVAEFPSRFRGEGAAGAPAAAVAPAAAAPAPAAAAAAAPAVAAAAPAAAVVRAPGRVERPLSPPRPSLQLVSAPPPARPFAAEVEGSFEDALAQVGGPPRSHSRFGKWVVALGMPLLGALPFSQKKKLEAAVGESRFFSAAGATGLNVIHNMLIYPIVLVVIGVLALDRSVFSNQLRSLIILGVILAAVEAIWRLREGLMQARPADEIVYRGSWYGLPLAIVAAPLLRLLGSPPDDQRGTVGVDGFHGGEFEDKLERERRYGEVYTIEERENGYLLRMELPRRIPPSAQKLVLGMPDEMPDYKLDLSLQNGFFVVSGKVVDQNLRKAAAVSPAFPPDFTKKIQLARPVSGFRHRYENKVLEAVLLRAS